MTMDFSTLYLSSAADVSELLELRLKQLGVKVYTGVTALEVSYDSDKTEFVTSVPWGKQAAKVDRLMPLSVPCIRQPL